MRYAIRSTSGRIAAAHDTSDTARGSQTGRAIRLAALAIAVVSSAGCDGPSADRGTLIADTPIHLEEHLAAANVVGSEAPESAPTALDWHFDEPQPDWKPTVPLLDGFEPVEPEYVDGALRMSLRGHNRNPRNRRLVGSLYVELPDVSLHQWSHVEVRARAADPARNIGVSFNYSEDDSQSGVFPFYSAGRWAPLVPDGTVQTYLIPLEPRRDMDRAWTEMELWFNTEPEATTASLDLLSVSIVPREARYADTRAGVREEGRDRVYRRALYAHAPGRLDYRVRVPEGGRLDVGLGVLTDDAPATFTVTATSEDGAPQTLLERTHDEPGRWLQQSVDLSHLEGRTVTLGLGATSGRSGTTVLWGAPTISGAPISSARASQRPDVVFYVIDGAGAEYMSLYGYNRTTTPNLDRIAAEGAVFDRAYSNSHWTRPSTASFMTSLQHSVLGGFVNGFNVIPEDAPTMAQQMHRAGYSTGVFNANPNAGRISGLQRGVDFYREDWAEFSYTDGGNYRESSRVLHEAFWSWREEQPATPYWVHFQTVDIHEDFPAAAPFSGLFVGPTDRRTWREWDERLSDAGGHGIYLDSYAETGIERPAFFALHQALYDETMAHQDHQLGRLVERLKAEGRWENTLLIVGSDHSIWAAVDDMGIAVLDELPPRWSRPMFRPSWTRVPLVFVWPGRIDAGQRIAEPVSMLDVLPTILDLLDLPPPEVMQGQSLAPLLFDEDGWEPRPVILDEFVADPETGELRGVIEVVDGRWGASLEINDGVIPLMRVLDPVDEEEEALWRRPAPLLLYDLWNDPMSLHSLHEERPDLVSRYTAFLEQRLAAHRDLARIFTRSAGSPLSPEQLKALRALGYIR